MPQTNLPAGFVYRMDLIKAIRKINPMVDYFHVRYALNQAIKEGKVIGQKIGSRWAYHEASLQTLKVKLIVAGHLPETCL